MQARPPSLSMSSAHQLDPPGYHDANVDVPPVEAEQGSKVNTALYEQGALGVARGQLGGIVQTAFMMYFLVGNQLSLFNIIMLSNFGLGPLKNIVTVDQTFAAYSVPGVNLLLPKLGYLMLNLFGVAVIIWKIKAMGLLPITSADWLSMLPHKAIVDTSSLAFTS